MSTEPLRHPVFESANSFSFPPNTVYEGAERFTEQPLPGPLTANPHSALRRGSEIASEARGNISLLADLTVQPAWKTLSSWSCSAAKRLFDCVCVLLALPVLLPLILVIGAAVRLTSRGPILFLQERVGRHGRKFTIFKFRTMIYVADRTHHPITTSENQRFTPIGSFMRKWKLDELPQLANVLLGQMSLVGPRPKLAEHMVSHPPCRPGITGMATIVFACEETALARVPKDYLEAYYHAVVLPAKRRLDSEYMARATFLSDFQILVNSILRRWDDAALEAILFASEFEYENEMAPPRVSSSSKMIVRRPIPQSSNPSAEAEELSAF